jgi:predicted nuclease of predicted toxin-antitoxin system
MIRFLVDESFNNDVVRGVLRRMPDLDIVRAQDEGLSGVDDTVVLAHAASEGRIVLTHDVRTLIAAAWDRVRAGEPMPGVFAVAQNVATAVVVEELFVISHCSDSTEWRDQVRYLPLR